MKTSEMFPSKYVAAAELEGNTTVTIDRVTMEDVGMDKEELPVLFFSDYPKGLVLNKTNTKKIASIHGTDTELWAGKHIDMVRATTAYKGDEVDCIRIRECTSIPQ